MSDAAGKPRRQADSQADSAANEGFSRLRATTRKRGPLSFGDLSASLAQAQADTGFIDTVGAEAGAQETKAAAMPKAVAQQPTTPTETRRSIQPATDEPLAATPRQANPSRRRGRVRADIVQCNLKLPESVRDALHLQALRERRTIAELVTEVMSGYLTAKGTFDRLR